MPLFVNEIWGYKNDERNKFRNIFHVTKLPPPTSVSKVYKSSLHYILYYNNTPHSMSFHPTPSLPQTSFCYTFCYVRCIVFLVFGEI